MSRNKFISNTSWIIGGNVIQMAISFLISILTARYLGSSNYGLLNYSMSIVAIFSSFCGLGFNEMIIKFLIVEKDNQGEILGTAMFFRFLASIVSTFAVLIIVSAIKPNDKTLLIISLFQSIGVMFQSFGIISQWFQSKLLSKVTTVVNLIAYAIISCIKFFFLANNFSIIYFAFISILEYSLISCLFIYAYKYNQGAKFKINMSKGWEMLRQSYHFIISGFMVIAYSQMDKFMIGTMLDESSTGIYSVALNLCLSWGFVLGAVVTTATPLLYESKKISKWIYEKRLRQLNFLILVIAIIISLIVTLLSKFIILLFYGQNYILAVMPLGILSWYSVFQYLSTIRSIWTTCEGLQKYEKYISLLGLCVNGILNFILIKLYGITGAAIATLTTQVITLIFPLIFVKEMRGYFKVLKDTILLKDVIKISEIKELIKRK